MNHNSVPEQPSEDRPVDRAALPKQLAGSRVRLRNDPRQATTRYAPARVGHEVRADRRPIFPISSGHEPGRQKDLASSSFSVVVFTRKARGFMAEVSTFGSLGVLRVDLTGGRHT